MPLPVYYLGKIGKTQHQNRPLVAQQLDQTYFESCYSLFIKEKQKKSTVDEYNEIIFKKEIVKKGEDFIEYLNAVTRIYQSKILDPDLKADNETQVKFLVSIMRDFIPFSDWIPVFLAFCLKFQTANSRYKFLRIIERKYVVGWMMGVTTSKRINETSRILHVIETSKDEEEIFNHDLFDATKYKTEILNILNKSNFYREKFCKYILLRLDFMLSEGSNIEKTYTGIISVEHILPQNPKSDSEWMTKFTPEEREEYTNALGNLVLLSRRKNSAANNKPFMEKLDKYYSKGITDFNLTKEITNYHDWTVKTIKQRQQEKVSQLMDLLMEKVVHENVD